MHLFCVLWLLFYFKLIITSCISFFSVQTNDVTAQSWEPWRQWLCEDCLKKECYKFKQSLHLPLRKFLPPELQQRKLQHKASNRNPPPNMPLSLSCICVRCYRAVISYAAGCILEDLFCVNTCFTSSRSHQQMATISPSHFKQNRGWYKYFADHFNVCDQTSVCRPLLQLNMKQVLHVGSGWK